MKTIGSVDDVLALYERWGEAHYGEDVTQTAHALQTAALAEDAGAPDALVAAALLHDVGHLVFLADEGRDGHADRVDDLHEAIGARALARVFGPEVAGPIALHVTAKRYCCATDPAYAESLSRASVESLALQGGPLDAVACVHFVAHPAAEAALRLRSWDDTGKVVGLDVPNLAHFVPLLRKISR